MHENDDWNEIPIVHNPIIRRVDPTRTSEDLRNHQQNINDLTTNFSDIRQETQNFITKMEALHRENERQRKIRSRINLFCAVINCLSLIYALSRPKKIKEENKEISV